MYKKYTKILCWRNRHTPNILLTMKLITIILLSTLMQVSAATFAQTLTLHTEKTTLERVFKEIEKQTGYTVFWSSNSLDNRKLDVNFKQTRLTEVMEKCLEGQELTFTIENHTVVIRDREKSIVDKVVDYFNLVDIEGRITDEQGKPLPGATVRLKNGSKATITDASGRWSLNKVDEDAVLVVSFMGFKTQEVLVKGRIRIDVWLIPTMSELDDVVVVGYGTTKRKDLVGSIATVSGDDIRKQSATNFTQGLVGRAAGVQASRPNGAPGGSASIRIRGMSTVMGVTDPLFVIDGIVVQMLNGGGADSRRTTAGLMDPLAGIDVNDIENMEILKDATATAIYGSRAANGVIIVTTKKGKAGQKPVFSLNYDVTADRQTKFYNILSAPEYIKFVTELYAANGQKIPNKSFPGNGNTDWQREVARTGLIQNLNLNLSGASKEGNTVYGFSSGITDQQGILINSGFKRYSIRANVESKVLSFFKIGTNLNFSSSEIEGGTSPLHTMALVANYRPDIPVFNPDGSYANNGGSDNPVAIRKSTTIDESQRLMATLFAELEIIPGLKARSAISYDINTNTSFYYRPSWLLAEINMNQKGSRTDRNFKYTNRVFDNTLNFTKSYNKHHIDAVAGVSWMLNQNKFNMISGINFPDDNVLNNIGSASSISGFASGGDKNGLESYFLRSNYNFDGKYYFSITARADNSTKFGPDKQWGYFPSAGLSWRFSKEKFMERLAFIDDAKLRLTVGETGTSAFGTFGFLTLFSTGYSYNGVNGFRASPEGGMPNPDIHWESTLQTDVALDLSFFKSRIKTSFNYYRKYTEGLITGPGVPVSTGFTYQIQNIGDVSNKGLEITITGIPIAGRDFTWISDFNITFNRNKIEKTYGTTISGRMALTEGLPLNGILGYRTNGLYQEKAEIDRLNEQARIKTGNPNAFFQLVDTSPGDVRYVDTNGDGVINTADRQILGYSQNPKYFGGWNNTLRYRNLELSTLLQFDVGSKIHRDSNFDSYSGFGLNITPIVLTAWTPDNRNTNQPRNTIRSNPQNIDSKTDRFIEDASFLRLKSVQLSYLLQAGFLKKLHIQQLRFFTGITNVLTWTKYKGLDPEADSYNTFTDHGRDTGVYPQARSMSFGINLKF